MNQFKLKSMKSKNLCRYAVVAIFATLTLSACKKEKITPNDNPTNANELKGNIASERTLDASVDYQLTGPLVVEAGGVLNIPAGTTIRAKKGFNNYILVLQGGKINVQGTAAKPVKMTADVENAQPGYWGGLIINGRAPLSGGTIGSTEISSAYPYGGNDPHDNSGSITYLEIDYSGARSSSDVEHNGLTLNGVGDGTILENIFISNGADDGVELFGGTINIKNLFVVNVDDDMFDFTQGYSGVIENAYGILEPGFTSTESDPRGVEADGNLDGNFPTASGQSNFTLKNVTFDLRMAAASDNDVTNVTNKMQDVIKVRRGANANILNALVKGSGTVIDLIDLKDGKGNADATVAISLTNSLTQTNLGKEINPETGFATAKVETGNAGCATNIFAWTNYPF